jgi:hypothetical protein
MPIFEYENYDDDEIFDFEENEFGDVKRKAPKKVVEVIRRQPQSYFRQQVQKLGQSTNVIDSREDIKGLHNYQLFGYLTWNTFFHLRMNVASNITNALQRRGFNVFGVQISDRDLNNSQYNFAVYLRVLDRYSSQQVKNSFIDALTNSVALPGSIRIKKVNDYFMG